MGALCCRSPPPRRRRLSAAEIIDNAHDVHGELRTIAILCGRVAGGQVALGGDLDECTANSFSQFQLAVESSGMDDDDIVIDTDSWKPVIRFIAECGVHLVVEREGGPYTDDELEREMALALRRSRTYLPEPTPRYLPEPMSRREAIELDLRLERLRRGNDPPLLDPRGAAGGD